MERLISSEVKAGNEKKAVREVVKNYETRKQDMYDETAEILKPSIDVQREVKRTIDEKQDELIDQMKENQEKMMEAIEFEPTKAITFEGKKLPPLDWIEYENEDEGDDKDEKLIEISDDEDEKLIEISDDEDEDKEVKPSTSNEKSKSLNIDKGITNEYKDFLKDKELPLPSEILMRGSDPSDFIKKVENQIKRKKEYITNNSTKKGQPFAKLKKSQVTAYKRNKIELPYLEDYLGRLNHVNAAPKYIGEGIYTQKKRNAYKISKGGHYGGLVIDLPKLHGHLKVVPHKNGQK